MQTAKNNRLKKELKDKTALIKCAEEFNLIGDPTRLKVCYLLCHHNELSVSEIADLVDVSISAVSHTLHKLKEADVVEDRRDFRHVYYSLKQSSVTNMLRTRLENI